MMSMSGGRGALASALVYAAAAALMGRHVLATAGSAIAGDVGDPVLNAAILAWNAQTVPWTDAWYQFPGLYPARDALTFSEHLLGVSVVASPLYWLTGQAVVTYNVTTLLTYVLCGLAMYALVWRLTHHAGASFLAGLAYAFAPYRAWQVVHIQAMAAFWAPLALLGLHGLLEWAGPRRRHPRAAEPALHEEELPVRGASRVDMEPPPGSGRDHPNQSVWSRGELEAAPRIRPDDRNQPVADRSRGELQPPPGSGRDHRNQPVRGGSRGELEPLPRTRRTRLLWLSLFAVCWMLQGAANGYLLVFFSLLVGLWVLWFVVATRRWRDLAMIAAAAVLALLPLVPILLRYVSAHAYHGLSRLREDILSGSADVTAVLCAPAELTFWHWLDAGVCGGERQLFPGVALIVVLAIGALAWRRSAERFAAPGVVAFYAAAALVMWVFSWGPEPRVGGVPLPVSGPYALLMLVPGVEELRVPARFWMMAVLCLCVLAGMLLPAILRSGPRASGVLVTLFAGALLADGWTSINAAPLRPSPPRPDLLRGQTVMTLPLGDNLDVDAQAQLDAVVGGWRSVNGYSGFEPRHYALLRAAAGNPEPTLLEPFLEHSDLHVIVVERSDRHNGFMHERMPGARFMASGNGLLQFAVPGKARASMAIQAVTPLPLAEVTASCSPDTLPLAQDNDPATRWECGPQQPGQEIVVDLGSIVSVASVVQGLGEFTRDYPRRLRVETSVDREVWELAWEGNPWPQAFEAVALEPTQPRMRIPFAPRNARFVRLRLTGADDVSYWSVAELAVWPAR